MMAGVRGEPPVCGCLPGAAAAEAGGAQVPGPHKASYQSCAGSCWQQTAQQWLLHAQGEYEGCRVPQKLCSDDFWLRPCTISGRQTCTLAFFVGSWLRSQSLKFSHKEESKLLQYMMRHSWLSFDDNLQICDFDVQIIPGSHYEKLRLAMASSAKDIQSAYRRQATKWHPDKWTTADCQAQEAAAEQFRALQEAHSVLADPTERARYDARLSSNS